MGLGSLPLVHILVSLSQVILKMIALLNKLQNNLSCLVLNSKVNTNVDDVIWDKVAFNTAMNTICALLEITQKLLKIVNTSNCPQCSKGNMYHWKGIVLKLLGNE